MTRKTSTAARAQRFTQPAPAAASEQAGDIGGPVGTIQQMIAARLAGHAIAPVVPPRTLDPIERAIEAFSRTVGPACLVASVGALGYLLLG